MIRLPAPAFEPAVAARRVSAGADPIWLASPGATSDTEILFDAVACDPFSVVRGSDVDALEIAWRDARRRWCSSDGVAAAAEIPMGVGWLAYDLARQWMPLPGSPRQSDDRAWPDLEFRFFDAIWMRHAGSLEAFVLAVDDAAAARLLGRLADVAGTPARSTLPGAKMGRTPSRGLARLRGTEGRTAYASAIARIQEYLRSGDVYQVNLARRLISQERAGVGDLDPDEEAASADLEPLGIAEALRAAAPAPHAIWLASRSELSDPLDRFVVGNSPERFLRVDVDRNVETRPIKGTRPRRRDATADAASRRELEVSAKDKAEHVMIVDLERNDLGRVAETGSVVCEDLLRVVGFPTVHHLVSTVRARLRADVGLAALLRATFPGGSITGAPKRRAMEIIDELEPARRGLYTGATGWLGAAGDLDLAIAIRTAVIDHGRMTLSVGGGIVIDSDAEAEWAETEDKARAFLDLSSDRGEGLGVSDVNV